MYFWVLKILLVSLHNKMGKGWNMRQFLKVVLKYAVLFYLFNFQNWRPFFWKAETQQASNCRTMASNLCQSETVQLCSESVNRSGIKSPYLPASRVILYSVWPRVFIGYLWKLLGDDFSSSLQAAAFASQFLDRLSGLRGLSGGSDRDALQHGQVRGELLVLWSQILCPSQFLWCGILLLFSLPLVLHLHRQVHCCYWPPGLSHQVHGVCVRGMHQHLLDSAHCVQWSCVLHRCQWRWDGGISKCSQLYRRLSNCCKSRMGFDKCSDIFYTFPHYGNSLW